MVDFPEDVLRTARAIVDDIQADFELDGRVLKHEAKVEEERIVRSIAAAIVADRRRPVVVVCENDFPAAVFSSTENAVGWINSAKAKDPTSPFATRIHRHHHSFIVDEKLK